MTRRYLPEDLPEVGRQRVEVHDVRRRDLLADSAAPLDRCIDGGPGGSPSEHEHLGVGVAVDRRRWDVRGDRRDLGGADVHHPLVVRRRVVDVPGAVGLLQPADAVHEPGGAGDGPRAGERDLVAQIRPEHVVAVLVDLVRGRGEGNGDVGQAVDRRQVPRLGTVREIAVGQQDHGRAVLQGDPDGLDGGVEALRRAVRSHDRQRCLAVASVERDVEVGGLGLGRAVRSTGRHAGCRRAAAAVRSTRPATWSRSSGRRRVRWWS